MPASTGAVRSSVVSVDDHRRFRASARALLESEGFDVVGEVADGDVALREAAALRPGLMLLDIQLRGPDGFAVGDELAESPSAPAVVLSSRWLVPQADEGRAGVRLSSASTSWPETSSAWWWSANVRSTIDGPKCNPRFGSDDARAMVRQASWTQIGEVVLHSWC